MVTASCFSAIFFEGKQPYNFPIACMDNTSFSKTGSSHTELWTCHTIPICPGRACKGHENIQVHVLMEVVILHVHNSNTLCLNINICKPAKNEPSLPTGL